MYSYHIENQLLIIKEIVTGNVKWQGKPYGCSVRKVITMTNLIGCIVLLDYYEFPRSEYRSRGNLILLSPNGETIWNAELPSSDDSYMDFKVLDQRIYANSWNGYYIQIEPTTGKI